MSNKRTHPDREKTIKRSIMMKEMEKLSAAEPLDKTSPTGFESGNSKTGNSGRLFDKVFVWNLPPVITCPGITEWCRRNCYNADDRVEKFPINRWCENLWWVQNKKDILQNKLISQLDEFRTKRIAVRIHSSGDFFSHNYIAFWKEIIKQSPNVFFWAYTRSWAVDELSEDIKELSNLYNLNLILSCDETMEQPILGLAKSIVYDSDDDIRIAEERKDGVLCPEQYNLVRSCADCGICIKKTSRNVYFTLH